MKRVKGMTLLEIVISIGIFALLSLLIVQCITSINVIIRRTTDMNERIYQEKVYVNTHQTAFMDDVHSYAAHATELSVQYGTFKASPVVEAVERVTKNDGSQEAIDRDNRLDSNLHFRFLEFGGIARQDATEEFNTGFITLEAQGGSVPEIVSVTVKGGGTQQVYMPGTTNPIQQYVLTAAQLDGGDGKFADGEQMFRVDVPETTSVVIIDWVLVRNGKEETAQSIHTFPANRLTTGGSYETVGKATAYFYDGRAFGIVR